MADTPTPTSLHQAIDALLRRPTRRIEPDTGPAYVVTAPCPLQQLRDALGHGSEGTGHTVPGSRLPLNADVLDLWVEIAADTAAWAAVLGVDRREYRQDTDDLPAVGRLLRAAAATAVSRTDRTALAERMEYNARKWARRIEQLLTPPEHAARGLRGVACGHCNATWINPDDPDQPRESAVWVEYGNTGIIRCLWCRACGEHVWRDDLVEQAGTMAA